VTAAQPTPRGEGVRVAFSLINLWCWRVVLWRLRIVHTLILNRREQFSVRSFLHAYL